MVKTCCACSLSLLSLIHVLFTVGVVRGQEVTDFDYYDRLRELPTADFTTLEYSEESNVIKVGVNDNNDNNYRLAELKVFMPFSLEGQPIDNVDTHNDAGALLLAVHHFNNIMDDSSSSPILTRQDIYNNNENDDNNCNVKLTMEIFDSQLSPITSTRMFTEVLQEEHNVVHPLPAGVIGAYRSATTSPIAVLTGVNGIPQISASSTSTDFDVKEQFPLFGRTVTSAAGEAKIALDFFISIGASHVGVLYITDAYGSSLQKAFQDAANEAGIETDSVAFAYNSGGGSNTNNNNRDASREINNAMAHLQRSQFRLFYAICYSDHVHTVISTAYDYGIIGTGGISDYNNNNNDDAGFLWTFPGLSVTHFHTIDLSDIPSDAIRGIGLFQIQGGITYDRILPNGDTVTPDNVPSNSTADGYNVGFNKFRENWREIAKDETFTNYVRSKLPSSIERIYGSSSSSNENDMDFRNSLEFSEEIYNWMPLYYDAVMGLGISMCRAGQNSTFFTGSEVFEEFSNLDFHGASGNVLIMPDTGTRHYSSLTFMLWNVQEYNSEATEDEDNEASSSSLFQVVPTSVYRNGTWHRVSGLSPFIYADGSTNPPKSLPPVDMEYNYIGSTGRAAGYALMGIVWFLCIISIIWMIYYRNDHVVVSAQPLFLVMVSIGSFVMAATILPLSMEELVTDNPEALDVACMASPWLYIMGSITALSALFAKTRGIHKAYLYPELDFIHVTTFDIFSTFALLSVLNAIVLLVWSLHEPLEWTRTYKDATDMFDRAVESYGSCENQESFPFVVVILVLNVSFLIVGNWWAYQSRNIETEYLESRYISISMAAVLQAWCMGIPILIVVWDTPQAKFFVETGIIFVTALAFLSLIYVPKVIAAIQDRKKSIEEEKKRAYARYSMRQTANKDVALEDDESESSTDDKNNKDDNDIPTSVTKPEASNKTSELSSRSLVKQESGGFSTEERRRSSRSSSGRFRFSGAMKSDEVSGSFKGLKIVHNPRSQMNLSLTQGRELSRKQLMQFKGVTPADGSNTKEGRPKTGDKSSALPDIIESDSFPEQVVSGMSSLNDKSSNENISSMFELEKENKNEKDDDKEDDDINNDHDVDNNDNNDGKQ